MEVKLLVREALTLVQEAQKASYAEHDVRLESAQTLLYAAIEGLDEIENAWRVIKNEQGCQ